MLTFLSGSYTTVIIFTLLLFVFIVAFIIITVLRKSFKHKKMYEDIYNVLGKIIEERKLKDVSVLKTSEDSSYDFYLETRTHIYYIKAISNFKNEEICVNSKLKWQIIGGYDNAKTRYVEDIQGLMNLDVSYPSKKTIKKLYVIYPNARTLLRYINECEMTFIYPDTNVYDCNIVTYQALSEHREYIEAK